MQPGLVWCWVEHRGDNEIEYGYISFPSSMFSRFYACLFNLLYASPPDCKIELNWKLKWNRGIKVFFRFFEHASLFHLKILMLILLLRFIMCFWSKDCVEFRNITICSGCWTCSSLFFQCMLPAVTFTLTGSPLLLSTLWNPEAVKQIVKWRVSTFRQHSNPERFFPLLVSWASRHLLGGI